MDFTKVYLDYSEVTIDSGTFMTELTWLKGSEYGYTPKHYFIDYPGAKDLERQISQVIGGSPLVRYSAPVVLRTFLNDLYAGTDIPEVLFSSKDKAADFISYLDESNIEYVFVCGLYSDPEIDDFVHKARQRAATRFGNAL